MGSSSLTRDRTLTPCIETWSLSHWTTREVLDLVFCCDFLNFSTKPRTLPFLGFLHSALEMCQGCSFSSAL